MKRHDWREILRGWLRTMPSGTIFKSRHVFDWAARSVEFTAADLKPIGANRRAAWRRELSSALSDLHRSGELIHPGHSPHAWLIP